MALGERFTRSAVACEISSFFAGQVDGSGLGREPIQWFDSKGFVKLMERGSSGRSILANRVSSPCANLPN